LALVTKIILSAKVKRKVPKPTERWGLCSKFT